MEKKKKITYILLVITRKINNEKRKQLLNKHINSNNENKFKTKTVFSKKIQKKKKAAKQKRKRKRKIELYSCTMKKNKKK